MQPNTTNESHIGVPSRLCSVCGDISTGIHFGGNSCESCKAFFRRSVQCLRFQNYKCSSDEQCPVNIVTRKVCQFCRYTKCTSIGMKPKWVLSDQEREEKYGARRKRFRENRVNEEDPDIYKYLTKEEKVLVEDIAHALYQSRATYPLNFPSPSLLFAHLSGTPPTTTPTDSSTSQSTTEKPPSASGNLLVVPIQRLVLFARMLKDFDLFSEDDKVALLKGSAVEIMVCSSNTLFNSKTHTFTNYLSRDQRAVMDDQIMPLDPLLTRLWGEEVFNRTKNFLISMCNLHIDEITSTLLVPVILFSSDRLNIKNIDLVKRLQEKYVSLVRKYMNWRYGVEQTDIIYPKLLLQIINIRTLSLAHGEIIQRLMTTSKIDPLVQEVTVKPEPLFNRTTTERMESLSITSSPRENRSVDLDKTPSNDTESNNGSDDEDANRKQSRPSIDEDLDFDNEDSNETNPKNIWRKRQKLSNPNQFSSEGAQISANKSNTQFQSNINQLKLSTDPTNVDRYPIPIGAQSFRRLDHQVPTTVPILNDETLLMSTSEYPISNDYTHSSLKSHSFITDPHALKQLQELYRAQSAISMDSSPYDYESRSNVLFNNMIPPERAIYDEQNPEVYHQHYRQMSSTNYQEQQNEELLQHSSFANTLRSDRQSHITTAPTTVLNDDEQQLLNAIHSHPNKRDLVLNLLRQMNEESSEKDKINFN